MILFYNIVLYRTFTTSVQNEVNMDKKSLRRVLFKSWYFTTLSLLSMAVIAIFMGFLASRFLGPAVFINVSAVLVVTSVLMFIVSEPLVNLMMRSKVATKEDHPHFVEAAEKLFRHKRMWLWPRLYILQNLNVPNAMAFGFGFFGQCGIGITKELYELLEPDELEAVVAHELAHVRCKDVGLLTVVGILVGGTEKTRKMLLGGKTALGKGPVALFLAALFWFVSKVVFGFLRSALSQERELAADALGASYIGSPEPLCRALKKLASTSKRSADHSLSDLMVSHPGIEERIDSLQSLKGTAE